MDGSVATSISLSLSASESASGPGSAWVLAGACIVLALALGSIPFGLVVARRFAGKDPQLLGSGNIGAANVTRIAGARLGVLTLALDALKGAAPVVVAEHLAGSAGLSAGAGETLALTVGTCAVVAHCFSPWLGFRGGKGVATYAGVVLAVNAPLAGLGCAAFAVVFAVTRRASVASLVGVLGAAAGFAVWALSVWTLLPVVVASTIIVARHRENLRRLMRHTEPALHVGAEARPAAASRERTQASVQETKAP